MAVMMDKSALEAFLAREFPQVGGDYEIEDVADMAVRVRLKVRDKHLRPGGTVSGPSLFALADIGTYLAVLAMIGPQALAVTTNISMDFMRKPAGGADLIGQTRLLKLGRRLAVGECLIYSVGMAAPVARASMTYAIPPATQR